MYKRQEPADVVRDKTGSSSEKSMLLINMLINAGLDAKPVWISTRKNGIITPDFCDGGQFNRLICMLKIKSKNYFLYPVSARNPFGCLTPATEVGQGLLIEEEKGCLLYTSDAADERSSVDLGGRRILKKKTQKKKEQKKKKKK